MDEIDLTEEIEGDLPKDYTNGLRASSSDYTSNNFTSNSPETLNHGFYFASTPKSDYMNIGNSTSSNHGSYSESSEDHMDED